MILNIIPHACITMLCGIMPDITLCFILLGSFLAPVSSNSFACFLSPASFAGEGNYAQVKLHLSGRPVRPIACSQLLQAMLSVRPPCRPRPGGGGDSPQEGGEPGIGKGFCAQTWCYVDACNCDIPTMPKVASYVPDARFQGKPVFYSYTTCGSKDMWADEAPAIGSAGCRCIGFDNIPGTIDIKLKGSGGKTRTVSYPAEIGGTCSSWDEGVHPMCKGKKPPQWCTERWCYVDPCSCKLSEHPKATLMGRRIVQSLARTSKAKRSIRRLQALQRQQIAASHSAFKRSRRWQGGIQMALQVVSPIRRHALHVSHAHICHSLKLAANGEQVARRPLKCPWAIRGLMAAPRTSKLRVRTLDMPVPR